MTTSIPSGLGTSVGFSAEGTVGTATTSGMRWIQHDKVTAEYVKGTVTSTGLHQGLYQQGKRRNILTKQAKVQFSCDVAANKMGLLFKQAIGSTAAAAQVGGTAAWLQTHIPGDSLTQAMTVQVNKAASTGTLQQFTYSGCKIIDWQLAVARGQIAKWDMTMDAWLEDTSTGLAAVSYVATDVQHFAQGSMTVGGTVVAGPPISITSPATTVALIQDITIKGVNPLKTDRFTLGSTTKAEQLSNNFRQITGTVTLEFANLTDLYTAYFTNDAAFALHFKLTGPIIASANAEFTDVILPQCYIDGLVIDVPGPDVLTQKVTFTALDDGTTQPIQIQYQSSDVAV